MHSLFVAIGCVLLLCSQLTLSIDVNAHGRDPIASRVNNLLAQMTLTEKIYQLTSWEEVPDTYAHGVGQLKNYGNDPASTISDRNNRQAQVLNQSRLGIPAAFAQEVLHSSTPGDTVFPMPIAQGCTWNASLVTQIASTIARGARAVGTDVFYAPVVNLWIDPRFGRISEGFSSNPTLTSFMARAAVAGYQNDSASGAFSYLPENKGISLAKHFVAYGAALGGLNAAPADVSRRTMFEVFLKPWRAFARAGGRGAMASHNTVDHVPMHANKFMINQVFRNRFGFGEGQIVSDCDDIGTLENFRISRNRTQSAARALQAGVDQDLICGSPYSNTTIAGPYLYLEDALKAGWINETMLNVSVSRILAGKFAVGLFDNNTYVPTSGWKDMLNSQQNIDLAYQAALESITLLHSNNDLYSLQSLFESGALKKLAIVGPMADCNAKPSSGLCDTATAYLGPYTNSDGNIVVETLFEAFGSSSKYNTSLTLSYAKGVDVQSSNLSDVAQAVSVSKNSDAVIVVLGDDDTTCGEWLDNNDLNPPGMQMTLLNEIIGNIKNSSNDSVASSEIPIVLVVVSGRPFTFNNKEIEYAGSNSFVLDNVDLIISSFRPGQMGGPALRDVIMGDAENSGRLAQSWPKSVGDVLSGAQPWLQEIRGKWISNSRSTADADGRIYDSYQNEKNFVHEISSPLFEFGLGLSNTGCLPNSFVYSNLSAVARNVSDVQSDDSIVMSVYIDVVSDCKVDATDVIQIYLVDPYFDDLDMNSKQPVIARYWKRLVGFEKFKLSAGDSLNIRVDVRFDDVAVYTDEEFEQFELVHGNYTVRAGQSSRTDTLYTSIIL